MARPALSAQKLQHMQQRLTEAALHLYKTEGYEAVSLRRLAAYLDISYTQPYRVFDNKDELFASVRLLCYQRFQMAVVAGDIESASPPLRLLSIARALLTHVQANTDEYRLMFSLHQPPLERYPELLAIRQDVFDFAARIIQLAIDQGQVEGEARTLTHLAWASAHGLLTLHAGGQLVHGQSLDELIEPMLRRIFGPMMGEVPTTPRPERLQEHI